MQLLPKTIQQKVYIKLSLTAMMINLLVPKITYHFFSIFNLNIHCLEKGGWF